MRNLKKVLALVLVFALSLTMFAGAIQTILPFDDLKDLSSAQSEALKLVYALGIFKGDGEGSLLPSKVLTRAELCAVLYRLYTGDEDDSEVDKYSGELVFSDVAASEWYAPYIHWAYLKNVVVGYGNGKFGPNDEVTGVQAVKMAACLLGNEIGSDNWENVSKSYDQKYGFTDGITTKSVYSKGLTRGDMILIVANTLNCTEVDEDISLVERVYDLEIIHGAILTSVEKLGSKNYSLFAFKGDKVAGDVRYFIADKLSVEEGANADEIGQKYTLYVAKTKQVNGYRYLYAAFEEDEGDYYGILTGTVDDGKYVFDTKADNKTTLKRDDKAIYYVNGAVVTDFDLFAVGYGAKNNGTYKFIDTDGDGDYDYLFIQKLTLATMQSEVIVASVSSFNNITGAYTLSNGETYVAGEYWNTDKDGKITNKTDAAGQITGLIGTGTWTVSTVKYAFTVSGKYIMKVEICDDTYFAGSYVLSLNVATMSTFKGYSYVSFLTEDNTAMSAYVRTVDHMSAANWTIFNNRTDFIEELFYVSTLDGDYIDLFTPDYVNSNYARNYLDGNNRDTVIFTPNEKFNINVPDDAIFARIAAAGFGFTTGGTTTVVSPNEAFVSGATYLLLKKDIAGVYNEYVDSTTSGTPSTPSSFTYSKTSKDTPTGDKYALVTALYLSAVSYKTLIEDFADMSDEVNENDQFDLTDCVLVKLTSAGETLVKTSVDLEVTYETTELQIFKVYGTWYVQNYGNERYDALKVFFTNDNGVKSEVTYNDTAKLWYLKGTTDAYYTGVTTAEAIYNQIINTIIPNITRNDGDRIVYDTAKAINTTKGVVFAYGKNPTSSVYLWRAYNFDEFNSASFGRGGRGDDKDFFTIDEIIYTTDANNNVYAKAIKVTVSSNDTLPIGWQIEGSKMFIWGDMKGTITGTGRTITALLPNGATDSYFVTFGNNYSYNDVMYVTFYEDGSINTLEKLSTVANIKGSAGNLYSNITDPFTKVSKDGVVTFQGKLGITYTEKLDLDKTFFFKYDSNSATGYVGANISAAAFADLDAAKDGSFEIKTINGYNFVFATK